MFRSQGEYSAWAQRILNAKSAGADSADYARREEATLQLIYQSLSLIASSNTPSEVLIGTGDDFAAGARAALDAIVAARNGR